MIPDNIIVMVDFGNRIFNPSLQNVVNYETVKLDLMMIVKTSRDIAAKIRLGSRICFVKYRWLNLWSTF